MLVPESEVVEIGPPEVTGELDQRDRKGEFRARGILSVYLERSYRDGSS